MPRLLPAALTLFALLSAAPRAAAQAPDARPIVLVIDAGRARVSAERLMRRVATEAQRDVVRITDPRAGDPAGLLTIANEGPGAWLVRFESRGRSAIAHQRIRRPGAYDAELAAAAMRVMGEVEETPEPAPAAPDDRSLYVTWADEILDPFAGLPAPSRGEMVVISEVIDPFGPATARRVGWTEVLDPWAP